MKLMRFTGDVLTVVNKQGRTIGHVNNADTAAFEAGDLSVIVPVYNWRVTFSPRLMRKLGLSLPNRSKLK